MYRRGDPRWNRTIQHISENLEHANETAAENIYGFTQRYVSPCLASLTTCCNAVTAPCFPSTNDRRRNKARARGRAELSFDFYDDWEHDESDGLLGWGNDNLERFLGAASNYGTTAQPGRQRAMSYGQRARDPRFDAARRKSTAHARDAQDPTLIPSSSYFGFLGRLPFNLGGHGLRYKPSAADLTDHPGAQRRSLDEDQPLIEGSDEESDDAHAHAHDYKTHRRARSNTHTSGHTTDSFSSRGDIFPSEDELDDAVPLDDEFTIALERRTTGQWDDGPNSSGRNTRSNSKRPSRSASSRTVSSGKRSNDDMRPVNASNNIIEEVDIDADANMPTLDDLSREEDRLRLAEEADVARKRLEARQLAVQRGLASGRDADVVPFPGFSDRAGEDDGADAGELGSSRPATAIRRGEGGFAHVGADVADIKAYVEAEVDDEDVDGHADVEAEVIEARGQRQEQDLEEDFIPARLPRFG
ncbi:hypothetical protein N0V95_005386 [Ascochyta clinopodiicola]|nr:hypothetical protein N0V95_005386 [Ascochyta clinopodiicola]